MPKTAGNGRTPSGQDGAFSHGPFRNWPGKSSRENGAFTWNLFRFSTVIRCILHDRASIKRLFLCDSQRMGGHVYRGGWYIQSAPMPALNRNARLRTPTTAQTLPRFSFGLWQGVKVVAKFPPLPAVYPCSQRPGYDPLRRWRKLPGLRPIRIILSVGILRIHCTIF